MKNRNEEHKTVKDLAYAYREVIDIYSKRIPLESKALLSRAEFVQFLGSSMDLVNNRKLAIGDGSISITLYNVLGDKRARIFLSALREYDFNTYGDVVRKKDLDPIS